MIVGFRRAHPNLQPFLLGFVEHYDLGAAGASIDLPFATPVIHVALHETIGSAVALCAGRLDPVIASATRPRHVIAIALGFTGVSLLSPLSPTGAWGSFHDIADRFWSRLRSQLRETPHFNARVELLEQALTAKLEDKRSESHAVLRAADAIAWDRWAGAVHDLADRLDFGERTLRSRFNSEIGCSPKRLLRIARFNRAVRALHPNPWAANCSGDARLEFFDDAHFHREFRAHAGISPGAFVAAKRRTGDALIHSVSHHSVDGALN